jgi:hypothetical protein
MPVNFREGMRRIGIVTGVLGSVAGAIGGYFLAMDAHASAAKGLLGEPVLVDYAVAASLPVLGFLAPWAAIRVLAWIWAGFSAEPGTRDNLKASGKITRLTKLMNEAEHLLRKHGEESWAKWLREGGSHIRSRDFRGIEHILSGFGGTGSFNDIYICPANHHAIKERNVGKVNDRLRVLSSGIYEVARELQDEELAAQSIGDRGRSGQARA